MISHSGKQASEKQYDCRSRTQVVIYYATRRYYLWSADAEEKITDEI